MATDGIARDAARVSQTALLAAGVRAAEVHEMAQLHPISDLFAEVWGRNDEGVPMPTEVLRSIAHAGGLISAVYDVDSAALLGAAVLGRDEPGSSYGYIAAARPGAGDRGIGYALKQHQRAWCLARGITRMRWTFDPLVSRNARFNLSKLGAVVDHYELAFYGQMSDAINGSDPADRLVADWRLDGQRAIAAGQGTLSQPTTPATSTAAVSTPANESEPADSDAAGPDGGLAFLRSGAEAWCRVPTDIVELRRTDPAQASAWRLQVRERLSGAFADGWLADGANRDGWYHLTRPTPDREEPK